MKFLQLITSEKLGKIIQINIITSQGLAFKEKYLTDWRAWIIILFVIY